MGIDATVLGSRRSPTSPSVGNFARLVSFKSGTLHFLADQFLTCGSIPTWKYLITNQPLATNEGISLIASVFSDRKEIEAVKHLRRDDAQSLVDTMDEVLAHFLFKPNGLIDLDFNFLVMLIDVGQPRVATPEEMSDHDV